jgi:hypothetical protein
MKSPQILRAWFVLLLVIPFLLSVPFFSRAAAGGDARTQFGARMKSATSFQPKGSEWLATPAVPAHAVQAQAAPAQTVTAQTATARAVAVSPALSRVDRVRLQEVFRLGDIIGDRVWPGWSKAPFAVLLVTAEYEFLMRHPKPSADFTNLGYDALLKTDVYYRKRNFSTQLLATFPAISGSADSTIVVGQAENTMAKTSSAWVIMLLHEHFHQLQDSQPNFYRDVNALNLAHGDQSGMWMLNYAFPYERTEVQEQFAVMSKLLAAAIEAPKPERAKKLRDYLEARQKFQGMLEPDDYKYFSFQFWKEGIARYTEYRVAQMATANYRVSKEFRALPDYQSFSELAKSTRARIFRQLETQKLGEAKREVVYSFGAAEGLLLDQINPGWRRRYFVEKFDLRKLYP